MFVVDASLNDLRACPAWARPTFVACAALVGRRVGPSAAVSPPNCHSDPIVSAVLGVFSHAQNGDGESAVLLKPLVVVPTTVVCLFWFAALLPHAQAADVFAFGSAGLHAVSAKLITRRAA